VYEIEGVFNVFVGIKKFTEDRYMGSDGSRGEDKPYPYGSVLHQRKCRPSIYRGS
jgi:hypothetical protein